MSTQKGVETLAKEIEGVLARPDRFLPVGRVAETVRSACVHRWACWIGEGPTWEDLVPIAYVHFDPVFGVVSIGFGAVPDAKLRELRTFSVAAQANVLRAYAARDVYQVPLVLALAWTDTVLPGPPVAPPHDPQAPVQMLPCEIRSHIEEIGPDTFVAELVDRFTFVKGVRVDFPELKATGKTRRAALDELSKTVAETVARAVAEVLDDGEGEGEEWKKGGTP